MSLVNVPVDSYQLATGMLELSPTILFDPDNVG